MLAALKGDTDAVREKEAGIGGKKTENFLCVKHITTVARNAPTGRSTRNATR